MEVIKGAAGRCEYMFFGRTCHYKATYVVAVGTRKTDEQLSCRRHLAGTVDMMILREERAGARVMVRRYHPLVVTSDARRAFRAIAKGQKPRA